MDWDKFDFIKRCIVSGSVPDSVYMDPTNCECFLDIRKAVNFADITEGAENINGCVVEFITDSCFQIVQVSGYSADRGLFCDLI